MVFVTNPADLGATGRARVTVRPRVTSCFARGFMAKLDL